MTSESLWGNAPLVNPTPDQSAPVAPTSPQTRSEAREAAQVAQGLPAPLIDPQQAPVAAPAPLDGAPVPAPAQSVYVPPVEAQPAPAAPVETAPTPPMQPQPLQTVKVTDRGPFTDQQLNAARSKFEHLMGIAAGMGVSDVHIVGDSPMRVQRAGGLDVIPEISTSNQELLQFVELYGKARGGAHELQHGRKGTVECMTQVGEIRLRMTFVREVHGYGCTARIVPGDPPRITDAVFTDNPIPEKLVELALKTRGGGLIIAEGPTGSGKTTLIAALLNEINETLDRHIYTIEDPIEFLHRSKKSLVTQREIGEHAETIPGALRTSLRYKPHVILVAELLDLETVRGAIEAANKGHLIFATSHASSAEEGVSALVNQFPGSEQKQIQVALSQALKAVVVQRLIPRVGGGMVPARELMLNTIPVALKIREGQFNQIAQALKPLDGMFKFEHDLAGLIRKGLVTKDDAEQFCNDPKELESQLELLQREGVAVN